MFVDKHDYNNKKTEVRVDEYIYVAW